MFKRLLPGGALLGLYFLNVLDWFGRGQSLADLATGAPPVIHRMVLFLLSDVGNVSLLIAGFSSLLVAIALPPPPVALTRGGNPKAKQSWRTSHPLLLPIIVAAVLLSAGFTYAAFRTPYPPVQIALIPEFESRELFPILFRVRNGPVALHDMTYVCVPRPLHLEGPSRISGVGLVSHIEVDGILQPLGSRFRLAENGSNVVLKCAYDSLITNKPIGGRTEVELELSIAGVSGRRRITKAFDLSKDSVGNPLWIEAEGRDEWVTEPRKSTTIVTP